MIVLNNVNYKSHFVTNVLARVTVEAPWSVSATDLRQDLGFCSDGPCECSGQIWSS